MISKLNQYLALDTRIVLSRMDPSSPKAMNSSGSKVTCFLQKVVFASQMLGYLGYPLLACIADASCNRFCSSSVSSLFFATSSCQHVPYHFPPRQYSNDKGLLRSPASSSLRVSYILKSMLTLEYPGNKIQSSLVSSWSQQQRNVAHTLAAAAVLQCGTFLQLLLQLFIVVFLLCLHKKVLKEESGWWL